MSKPFNKAAQIIADGDPDDTLEDALDECRGVLDSSVDEHEAKAAEDAIDEVLNSWSGIPAEGHRLLIIAKDCAVRAHLPDSP